jgi:hypothetical protein
MADAFQPNAFQNDAFQIDGGVQSYTHRMEGGAIAGGAAEYRIYLQAIGGGFSEIIDEPDPDEEAIILLAMTIASLYGGYVTEII